jgi:hypothetical protein
VEDTGIPPKGARHEPRVVQLTNASPFGRSRRRNAPRFAGRGGPRDERLRFLFAAEGLRLGRSIGKKRDDQEAVLGRWRVVDHVGPCHLRLDQVRGKLGDRFLRIELADHLAPKSTPFRVPSGLREAIDRRIAPAGLDALHLLRAIRDVNKDVPDNPDKLDAVTAAIIKLKKSLVPLAAEVGIQVGFR